MSKIAVVGGAGKMGSLVCRMFEDEGISTIVVDKNKGQFNSILSLNVDCDLVVDFSHPSATNDVANYCTRTKTNLVVGTTGQNSAELETLKELSKNVSVLLCSNFSLGINCLADALSKLSQNAQAVSIVERHHDKKIDCPSGTAIFLAKAMCSSGLTFDCSDLNTSKARQGHISVHSIRQGDCPGRHEITISLPSEEIVLTHMAYDRTPFAKGVVFAAKKMLNITRVGMYDFASIARGDKND